MLNANDFSKKQIIFLIPKDGDKLTFSNDNIVVKDKNGKITFSNVKATLLYTYFKGSHNFKVYPYTKLNNSLLNNYETYYNKYKGVLTKYTNIVEVE